MNIKLTAFPTLAMLLALTLSTQSHATGFHSCEATDEADWATVEALKEKVEADGFEYRRHKPDGGCYEVYIKYTDGRIAEAYYHPVTLELEIIQRRGDVLYEKPEEAEPEAEATETTSEAEGTEATSEEAAADTKEAETGEIEVDPKTEKPEVEKVE